MAEEADEVRVFPEFIGAKEELEFRHRIESLAEGVIRKQVGFLFGAGMSRDSGLSSGSNLARSMLRQTLSAGEKSPSEEDLDSLLSRFPFEAISEAFAQRERRGAVGVIDFLKDTLEHSSVIPNDGHKKLAQLAPHLQRLYTTNFEHLIEKEMGEVAIPISPTTLHDLTNAEASAARRIPVIHLHGMLVANDCVLTEKEVYRSNVLIDLFKSDLLRLNFVFVGYSLLDPDIRAVYMSVQNILQDKSKLNRKTYVVTPMDTPYDLIVANQVWSARGAEVIPISATDFMRLLVVDVEGQKEKELRRLLERRLNVSGDKLEHMITKMRETIPDMTSEDVLEYLNFLNREANNALS